MRNIFRLTASFLLSLALCTGFSSCGSDDEPEPAPQPSVPLTVVKTSIADGAEVPVSTSQITIEYSHPVALSTSVNITLNGSVVTPKVSNKTITIELKLEEGKSYSLVLAKGAIVRKDDSVKADALTINFKTPDPVKPSDIEGLTNANATTQAKNVYNYLVEQYGKKTLSGAMANVNNNNEFSGALAEKAVEISGQFLYRSYSDCNDVHARRKMHIAACLAGLAFNSASLGLNHGMAHQLGAQFHIPHGRANAILLPHIIEYNTGIGPTTRVRSMGTVPPCVRRYCNMARILGVANMNEVTTIRSLISYIHFLNEEMLIPKSVSEATGGRVTIEQYEAAIDKMAEAALADACTATNPRTPTKEDIVRIYRQIW